MSDRAQYTPGPANLARIQKDRGQNGEEKWTLVLVRELRHSPEKVWQALTDPAQLREWAPFEADGNLGAVGSTVRLTTVAAPKAQVSETTRDSSRSSRGARVQLGRPRYAMGTGSP